MTPDIREAVARLEKVQQAWDLAEVYGDRPPAAMDGLCADIKVLLSLTHTADRGLVEALRREAEQWKMEAMVHKSSLHEAYQAVTGATGEPGNWNGARPIIDEIKRLRQALNAHAEKLGSGSSSAGLPSSQEGSDTRRMDWLEMRNVEVRVPLPHGSRHLFHATTDDSYEGEEGPSDLRAKIDAALGAEPAASAAPAAPMGEEFLEFKEALSDLRSLRQEHRDLNGGGPGWGKRNKAAWAKVDELFADEDERAYARQQEGFYG